MQSDEDRKYYLLRERQERDAAASADRNAKAAHTDLADRYAALATPKVTRKKKSPVG